MFDTMTMTKATGAVCGSLLVYLFASWGAESLYHVGHDAHGDGEEMAQAYSIDTGAEEAPAAEATCDLGAQHRPDGAVDIADRHARD